MNPNHNADGEHKTCTVCAGIHRPAMTHTPGPWTISAGGHYVRYQGIHGPNICDTDVFGGPPDEERSNALLIAAAPDLLEALEQVLENEPLTALTSQRRREIVNKAEAAIRKAKGEQ